MITPAMTTRATNDSATDAAPRSRWITGCVWIVAAFAWCAWLSTSRAVAQGPCATCAGKDLVPCRSCPLESEAQVLFCSLAAQCRTCGGALVVPCPTCKSATGKAECEQRRGATQAWLLARTRELSAAEVGSRPLLCRPAHFELVFGPGPIEDCPVRDRHLQMHLYATRLETVWQRFVQVLALDAKDMTVEPRLRVAILRDDGDVRKLASAWCSLEVQGLGVTDGERGATVVECDPRGLGDDAALHRLVVHDVTHLLLHRLLGESLDEHGHGWLEAGLAHWFEADAGDGLCDAACWLGHPQIPKSFQGRRWRIGVREMLEAGTLPAVGNVIGRDVADLDLAQHAVAFALVDWLLGHGGSPASPTTGVPSAAPATRHPLRDLLDAAKGGGEPVASLRRVVDIDLAALDEELRDFIRARYPRR